MILVQTASRYDDIMLLWRVRVMQDVMAREGRVQDVVARTGSAQHRPFIPSENNIIFFRYLILERKNRFYFLY